MADPQFVHLHLHTDYSMLDGAVRIKDLMKKTAKLGMPAVAMTDHGNLFGAVEFYQEAKKANVKPIIGCEVYLAPGSMREKSALSQRDASSHFTLLAKDGTGYRNLTKLVTAAWLDGFYYKPRIDKELLAQHSEGLIGLSGCLKGEVNLAIQADQTDKARQSIGEFRDILGADHFFLELHDHGIEAQIKCNKALRGFAKEFGLGLVAANDVHFLERSHHEAHDVMICIGTGAMVHDEKRMHYPTEVYFKTAEEMELLFADVPEALENTLRIAERCNLELEFGVSKYPAYPMGPGESKDELLRELCVKGMVKRFGERAMEDAELTTRLNYELSVLIKSGFVDYFLITWDFIHYAKQNGIPVGPGRGSAAGSLVAYLLEITDLNPLRFGLIFERFLNPERVSPPDIDIDFCQSRRGEVIDYVKRKYGHRAVSQIVTFGTMGAKSVVRDVGRVMGMSYSDGDRIAKMIPDELNIKLTGHTGKDGVFVGGAIDKNPELAEAVKNEPATRQLWEYATVLEGLSRNTGIHAARVVIGDRDLSDYIPLCKGGDDEVVTQYAMGPLTDLGMLKMDFLGLKTLTVIQDAVTLIRERAPGFDLDAVPFEDQPTFDLLNRGETVGVFQLESGGMINLCRQFDIHSIEDIIALIALYRPGPMDLIPDYINRKKGNTKIKYAHPLLKDVCSETYGVMIYQEQVQRAANVLAGFSLGQADLLRRAMGKKDKQKMADERVKFVAGCAAVNGIKESLASEIFDLLEKFAGYGFNKSHSAAYGLLSYRTAWLKANYPVEFMCGLLGNEINNTSKISVFVAECKRMGLVILPPDVNSSGLKFVPEMSGESPGIRFGLAGIKNVGEGAMIEAISERAKNGPFESMDDFCSRLDGRTVNRKILESLVKCEAFDSFREDRAKVFARVESVMAASASAHRDRASGQVSLFDAFDMTPAAPQKDHAAPGFVAWTPQEKLAYEKELLGFYVTGHPLDQYRPLLEGGKYHQIAMLSVIEEKLTCQIAGAVVEVAKKFTKKDNKPFAIISVEDLTGSLEIMVWSDVYSKSASLLEVGKIVSAGVKVDKRDDKLRVTITEISELKPGRQNKPVRVVLQADEMTETDLDHILGAVREFPGPRPLELEFRRAGLLPVVMTAGEAYRITWTGALEERLRRWTVAG